MLEQSGIIYAIVTFREEFWKCSSFESLLGSYKQANNDKDLIVFIFDNTDYEEWFTSIPYFGDKIKIIYQRNNLNPGISVAYNSIALYAKNNFFKYIVFLDQDSKLPSNSYRAYTEFYKSNLQIAVPKVFSSHKLISPSRYILHRSFPYKDIKSTTLEMDGNSFINSGLIIKTETFFNAGCYNKKLRLDFCDHDFTQKLAAVLKQITLLPFVLHQNFSAETNSLEQAIFRYKMFEKDLKEYKVGKNSIVINLFVEVPHLLRLTLKYKTFQFFRIKF